MHISRDDVDGDTSCKQAACLLIMQKDFCWKDDEQSFVRLMSSREHFEINFQATFQNMIRLTKMRRIRTKTCLYTEFKNEITEVQKIHALATFSYPLRTFQERDKS